MRLLKRIANNNPFIDIAQKCNELLPTNKSINPIDLSKQFINNLNLLTIIQQEPNTKNMTAYVLDNLSDEDIKTTIWNTIKWNIPSEIKPDIQQIVNAIDIYRLKKFLSHYPQFVKEIYECTELIKSMSSSNRPYITLKSLDELLAQDDKPGTKYNIGIDFYLDITVSRERPWIIIDDKIVHGRKANGHGGIVEEYSKELCQEEHEYDENDQSQKLEKPFIFGYAKKDVAVIEGILETDIPAPSIDTIATILKQKYNKVYNQIRRDNLLVRLAKRIV